MERYTKHAYTFAKFSAVGVSNFVVDVGVFNIISLISESLFGIAWYPLFKLFSFLCAVINSYVWNKNFVFRKNDQENLIELFEKKEFNRFMMVSVLGALVNLLLFMAVFHLLSAQAIFLSDLLIANISVVATAVFSALWNYTGYHILVFNDRKDV